MAFKLSVSKDDYFNALLGLAEFNSCVEQETLKNAIHQLPSISFTHLHSTPPPLKDIELLEQAKELSSRVTNISEESEKIALLDQAFTCYKNFIKLNRGQISQRIVRDAAMEAVFVGSDMLEILADPTKKEALRLSVKKIQIISGYSSALHGNSLNQTLDALNIPQKHFAVSSQPLGTTNVKDCLFLVLRNRETFSTFAAHIDRNTDADSIKEAIKQHLPQEGTVDSYVIGGHLSDGPSISPHDVTNIPKVSRVLLELSDMGYSFDSRWCILQENTPINIVYYPKEDRFFEAVPGRDLSSYSSCEILVYLDNENKKLLSFFIDKQQGDTQCSLCLSPAVQKKLHLMLDQQRKCSKAKILDAIADGLPTSLRTYTQIKAIAAAYSNALDEISLIVRELSPHSRDEDLQKALAHVLESNKSASLYILPFSKEKNSPLITEILSYLQFDRT